MPIVLMAFGALMLVGGGAALALGLPYLVLERGFTQVIVGSVVATGGVIMIGLGLALREMHRSSGMAAMGVAAAAGAAGAVAAGAAALTGAAGPAVDPEPEHPRLPFIDEPAASPPQDEPIKTAEPEQAVQAEKSEAPAQSEASSEAQSSSIGDDAAPVDVARATVDPVADDASYDALRHALKAEMEGSSVLPVPIPEPAPAPMPEPVVEAPGSSSGEATASNEGVVGVRTVGNSTYTMYADGTVLAESPAGKRVFASLDELRAHLGNPAQG